MGNNAKDLTIEYDSQYKWFSLYEFGIYPRGSVLEGQQMKTFKGHYDTVEEAMKANPRATVGYRDPQNTFNHLPSEEMTAREEEMYFLDQHLDNDSILEIE